MTSMLSLKCIAQVAFTFVLYVMTLAKCLGCGAHVVELRRTDIKALTVEQAHSMDDIENTELKDCYCLLIL